MPAPELTALTLAASLTLAGCGPSASEQRGVRPADIQVVAQWLLPSDSGGPARAGDFKSAAFLRRYFKAEEAIEKASRGVYFEDGNDVGSGTFNVYLYTDHVDAAVAQLVALEHEGKIPPGLRIGVAQYADPQHKDWAYKPYYPAGLTQFEIMYLPAAPAKPGR